MRDKAGFIFSLEMALAVFVVGSILLAASYYATKSVSDPYLQLQALRTAEDITAVLDYSGSLTSFNAPIISRELANMLPVNYGMKITINGTFPEQGGYVETNESIPADRSIVGGSRIIVSTDGSYYGMVRYYIWLR